MMMSNMSPNMVEVDMNPDMVEADDELYES